MHPVVLAQATDGCELPRSPAVTPGFTTRQGLPLYPMITQLRAPRVAPRFTLLVVLESDNPHKLLLRVPRLAPRFIPNFQSAQPTPTHCCYESRG